MSDAQLTILIAIGTNLFVGIFLFGMGWQRIKTVEHQLSALTVELHEFRMMLLRGHLIYRDNPRDNPRSKNADS